MKTTRHATSPCLNCGKLLDASSSVKGRVTPRENNVTVCLYCRHVMIYRANLTLRNPTDDEIVEIAGDPDLVATINVMGKYREEVEDMD